MYRRAAILAPIAMARRALHENNNAKSFCRLRAQLNSAQQIWPQLPWPQLTWAQLTSAELIWAQLSVAQLTLAQLTWAQ